MTTKERGLTDYSERIQGEIRNHERAVRFDYTDGFVGINAYEGNASDAALTDRILLSPGQWKAIVAFVKSQR